MLSFLASSVKSDDIFKVPIRRDYTAKCSVIIYQLDYALAATRQTFT